MLIRSKSQSQQVFSGFEVQKVELKWAELFELWAWLKHSQPMTKILKISLLRLRSFVSIRELWTNGTHWALASFFTQLTSFWPDSRSIWSDTNFWAWAYEPRASVRPISSKICSLFFILDFYKEKIPFFRLRLIEAGIKNPAGIG